MPFAEDGTYFWIDDTGHIYFGCEMVPVETEDGPE